MSINETLADRNETRAGSGKEGGGEPKGKFRDLGAVPFVQWTQKTKEGLNEATCRQERRGQRARISGTPFGDRCSYKVAIFTILCQVLRSGQLKG